MRSIVIDHDYTDHVRTFCEKRVGEEWLNNMSREFDLMGYEIINNFIVRNNADEFVAIFEAKKER